MNMKVDSEAAKASLRTQTFIIPATVKAVDSEAAKAVDSEAADSEVDSAVDSAADLAADSEADSEAVEKNCPLSP